MTRLGPSHTELRFSNSGPSQAQVRLGSLGSFGSAVEDGEEEDEDDEDDAFEEEDIDVSDEILYDKDGNIIAEEDIGEGLKEIMERHMSALQKKLDVYATW